MKALKVGIRVTWHVNNSDASNSRGNWIHLKIIQKISE